MRECRVRAARPRSVVGLRVLRCALCGPGGSMEGGDRGGHGHRGEKAGSAAGRQPQSGQWRAPRAVEPVAPGLERLGGCRDAAPWGLFPPTLLRCRTCRFCLSRVVVFWSLVYLRHVIVSTRSRVCAPCARVCALPPRSPRARGSASFQPGGLPLKVLRVWVFATKSQHLAPENRRLGMGFQVGRWVRVFGGRLGFFARQHFPDVIRLILV